MIWLYEFYCLFNCKTGPIQSLLSGCRIWFDLGLIWRRKGWVVWSGTTGDFLFFFLVFYCNIPYGGVFPLGGFLTLFGCCVFFFLWYCCREFCVRYYIWTSVVFVRSLGGKSSFIGIYPPSWLFSHCLRKNIPFDIISWLSTNRLDAMDAIFYVRDQNDTLLIQSRKNKAHKPSSNEKVPSLALFWNP